MLKISFNTFKLTTGVGLFILLVTSCIKNDIPYPRIPANFRTFEVADQSGTAQIDSTARTVDLELSEVADIYNVKVEGYTLTPGARITSPVDTLTTIDLSNPLSVTLSLYQDYEWTITATQPIERYFTVANQIGETAIDVPGRRVIFSIPETVALNEVKVENVKLGPAGSEMVPDLSGRTVDFTRAVEVVVTEHGRSSTWTIYAEQLRTTVFTTAADAWTNVAWIYGEAEAGKDNGIEYRRADESEWTRVPDEWLTINGGNILARIIHLQPETEYAARAFSNDEKGAELTFTTQGVAQMPNSNFEDWWLNGKVWNPWAEGGESYWDTGNKGATTLGTSNSLPTDDTPTGTGRAAMLKTEFKGIGAIGKLAAGSIFTGLYVRTDGTNGILSFGRPFNQRPTHLKGYLKYNCATISNTTAGYESLAGQPDTCIVWIALIDSPEPFEVRTNPKNQHIFDPSGPEVVAYGRVQYGETIPNYIPFDVELNYVSTSRVPNYIITVASASKYGDYFTGGVGSVLCVDDLQLLYDY